MDFEIQESSSIGPLKLTDGMPSHVAILGPAERHRPWSQVEEYFFPQHKVIIEYAPDGVCWGIQIYEPNRVILRGVQLIGTPVEECLDALEATGLPLRYSDNLDMIKFPDIRVAMVYNSSDVVYGVCLHQPGYYQESEGGVTSRLN